MKVLIIANSRFKGGASGGDKIYESFHKYWPCNFHTHRVDCEYKPMFFCYLQRIFIGVIISLFEPKKFDVVYTSSDFLPDCLAGFTYKLRGYTWVAGYFLQASRESRLHFYTQKICRWLIIKFSDMVIVTNPTMYPIFPNKKKTWINGGVDLKLAGLSDEPKIYDAVWCGRIHYTKGVDELIEIWSLVRKQKPYARLALIGDGDLGLDYVRKRIRYHFGKGKPHGIDLLGYMGDERYKIYKKSKVVLYTTPLKYDHFSMAPVEAMACGCPMVAFDNPVMDYMLATMWGGSCGVLLVKDIKAFDNNIRWFLKEDNGWLKANIQDAINYGNQFDYEKQALRVYNDIRRELFDEDPGDGKPRHGGDSPMPILKIA